MRRLICIVIGHHRPAVVVSRYDEGHPVPLVRCEHCGRLEPFTDEGLERAIRRVSERLELEVSEHEIVIRGECERCLDVAAVSRR